MPKDVSSPKDEAWPGLDDYKMLKSFAKGNNAGGMNHGIAIMERKEDGLLVVRKKAIESKDDHTSARESHILMLLSEHANINQHVQSFKEMNLPEEGFKTTWIVTELCDKGTLEELIRRARNEVLDNATPYRLPEEFLWHCFRGILNALLWLHWRIDWSKGLTEHRDHEYILHRDIKAGNVFVATDANHPYPRIYLGDFGSAIQYGELMRNPRGPARGVGVSTYFPPESPRFGRAGDVWCLGCTMVELMSLLHSEAFETVEVMDTTITPNRVMQLADGGPLKAPRPRQEWIRNCDWYSSELKECVAQCLREEFKTRPHVMRIDHRVVERFEKLVKEKRLAEPPQPLPKSVDIDPTFVQPT